MNIGRTVGLVALVMLAACASDTSDPNTDPLAPKPDTGPGGPPSGTDCIDMDRDGYGQGAGCLAADCDDSVNGVHPGATEVCDGVDNDCNNAIDDNLIAPACPLSFGVCRGARQQCSEGHWSDCVGAESYGPEYEAGVESRCDGLDNNCDDHIDEDCPCDPGASRPCGESRGECRQGLQSCVDGEWGPCDGQIGPQDESCNGRDDDCDGDIDEEVAADAPDCALTEGTCAGARSTCSGAAGWSECGIAEYGDAWRAEEGVTDCDNIDNDCDGDTDEGCECEHGIEQACGSNVGACQPGTQACARGTWGECRGATTPVEETCNGVDDDCDGNTDEGLEAPSCGLNQGVCNGAVQGCAGEAGWQACTPETYSRDPRYVAVETAAHCDDALDNDCDGLINEDCECADGDSQVCGAAIGQCTQGRQICTDGRWGECDGVGPTAEICDAIDNDCDGTVDEEIEAPPCALSVGVCAGAHKTCIDGQFNDCDRVQYGPPFQGNETFCDTLDNDCDGDTDEQCECTDNAVQSCGSDVGVCTRGSQTCVRGEWAACEGEVAPVAEVCDGLDNDCDENIDEGLIGGQCPLQQGVCAGSTQSCGGQAGWIACDVASYGELYVVAESDSFCDGRDNDCDGEIDEECECSPADEPPVCGSNIGECQAGLLRCVGGHFGECEGEIPPAAEICDGLDTDCDGATDEDLQAPPCAEQRGVCVGSNQQCGGDLGWVECVNAEEFGPDWRREETNVDCDGLDNDCDGSTDEACDAPLALISEIMFNGPGADGPNEFIEIVGIPGEPLGGMSLQAYNGNDSELYWEVSLDGRRFPFNSYFLIVSDTATDTLRDIADLIVPGADLQNGPDNLWLVWNDDILDAVGYGNFAENDSFLGEGTPAPAAQGQSITRSANDGDTDNNSVDFVLSGATPIGVPTPGGDPLPRIHVALRWDLDDTDMDVHFIRDAGQYRSEDDCYWENRTPDWGVIGDVSDNPRLDRDDIDGLGPEYIDYLRPPAGSYFVEVNYFGDEITEASTATVGIFIDGVLAQTLQRSLDQASRYWAVARIVIGADGMATMTAIDQVAAEPFDAPAVP